jgi:hypothetical protein
MTTITIHIDNEQNAQLLERMLKELSFVEDIEISNEPDYFREPKGSYQRLKKTFDKINKDVVFKNIENPSKWQKNIRDEW